jgi:hypothetical protein
MDFQVDEVQVAGESCKQVYTRELHQGFPVLFWADTL